MALSKTRQRTVLKQAGEVRGTATSDDPNFTGKDKALLLLARNVVVGVLIIVGGLFVGLFILVLTDRPSTSLFKDVVLSFIAVASGILGSILGYYYKGNEK